MLYKYVDSMGLYTNVNSLLFWVHYSSQKISENETALNCGFGFAIATQLKPQFKAVSLIRVCVIWKSVILILNEIPFVYVQEK